ncbi:MAG: hypothetical protein PHF63_00945 [Herbinix sp.]|nr:hypothetical protein [Herbinix sp.]
MEYVSRILQYFSKDIMKELNDVMEGHYRSNNEKTDKVKMILDSFDVPYRELGPGTNRYCIQIENYAFKIALDRYGVIDNWNEFVICPELYPYVVKVYETNGLINVLECVSNLTKEEFMLSKSLIRQTLEQLAPGYLLGDVGTIQKNYLNWGRRDNNELVILDFGYIFAIPVELMGCDRCDSRLRYDSDYNDLICTKCGRRHTFIDVKRRLGNTNVIEDIQQKMRNAIIVDKPITVIEENKEVKKVSKKKNKINKMDEYDQFIDALQNDEIGVLVGEELAKGNSVENSKLDKRLYETPMVDSYIHNNFAPVSGENPKYNAEDPFTEPREEPIKPDPIFKDNTPVVHDFTKKVNTNKSKSIIDSYSERVDAIREEEVEYDCCPPELEPVIRDILHVEEDEPIAEIGFVDDSNEEPEEDNSEEIVSGYVESPDGDEDVGVEVPENYPFVEKDFADNDGDLENDVAENISEGEKVEPDSDIDSDFAEEVASVIGNSLKVLEETEGFHDTNAISDDSDDSSDIDIMEMINRERGITSSDMGGPVALMERVDVVDEIEADIGIHKPFYSDESDGPVTTPPLFINVDDYEDEEKYPKNQRLKKRGKNEWQ